VIEMAGKCKDCEFCFPHEEYGFVCADAHYSENIADSLEVVEDCYSEGSMHLLREVEMLRCHFFQEQKYHS
jgi:hypothetical protein